MIRAHRQTKVYGAFAAVDGIDFQVTQGESFGILGPNGVGKSTTMRMLGAASRGGSRHDHPDRGAQRRRSHRGT